MTFFFNFEVFYFAANGKYYYHFSLELNFPIVIFSKREIFLSIFSLAFFPQHFCFLSFLSRLYTLAAKIFTHLVLCIRWGCQQLAASVQLSTCTPSLTPSSGPSSAFAQTDCKAGVSGTGIFFVKDGPLAGPDKAPGVG